MRRPLITILLLFITITIGLTVPGHILLGRHFSSKNIAGYILAIALAATLDHFFFTGQQQIPPPTQHPTPPPAIPFN